MGTHGSMNVHAEVKGEPQHVPILTFTLFLKKGLSLNLKLGSYTTPLASFIPTLGL